jgi:DNA-binding NarL/FixJ family response regulator
MTRPDQSPLPSPFHLLLATDRPAVECFFESLDGRGQRRLEVDRVAVSVAAIEQAGEAVERATAAVVDVALEPSSGIDVCQELHRLRPDLPVTALLCCAHAVTPRTLRALLTEGVSGVLDLETTADDAARTLESVARGGSVMHFQLLREHRALLREILTGGERRVETHIRLLELVALGLPDHEIGRRLHLSRHTVKHHIEDLRGEVGARNRIELAAWAGRHGFYSPDANPPRDSVPVTLAQRRTA